MSRGEEEKEREGCVCCFFFWFKKGRTAFCSGFSSFRGIEKGDEDLVMGFSGGAVVVKGEGLACVKKRRGDWVWWKRRGEETMVGVFVRGEEAGVEFFSARRERAFVRGRG